MIDTGHLFIVLKLLMCTVIGFLSGAYMSEKAFEVKNDFKKGLYLLLAGIVFVVSISSGMLFVISLLKLVIESR